MIETTVGTYTGRVLVDCSGWRAVLATRSTPKSKARHGMSFGIETILEQQAGNLHFYWGTSGTEKGFGWFFPAGSENRVGVAAYSNPNQMK